MRLVLIVLAFVCLAKSFIFAQTGPGGVGNATGVNSQPKNVLWLKANSGISSSGGVVDSWTDQSGNNNSATGSGATRPTFNAVDAQFNNLPSISFPVTGVGGQNYFLQIPDNDNLDNSANFSIFCILRPTTPPAVSGILSKRTSAGNNVSYGIQISTTPRYQGVLSTGATYTLSSTGTIPLNTLDILSLLSNGTNINGLLDGGNLQSAVGPATIPNTTSNLFIGSFDNQAASENFEGKIAEVIMFGTTLNVVQRQILENYLSSKYNTPLALGDLYAGDVSGSPTFDHDFDLIGIGYNGGVSHLLANSQGLILSPSGGTLDTNGEFVLAAHDGVTNAVSTSNLGTGGVVQRWARSWYVDRTPPTGIDANITFDFSDGINGQFPQNKNNYVLLRLNTGTGNYDVVSAITNSDKTLVGDQITFRVADANLLDGTYTLGTSDLTNSPVNGVSNRTWYSYQSGNWNSPTSWTLDGGIFPLFVNPSSEIPTLTDNVVITSGRTITMDINNVQVNSIDVEGTLDLLASSGHNFVTISGNGRIKMAGATDNFPAGVSTDFASASIGGTLEINGTGISLNVARTFKNLEINMATSSSIATLDSDYILNGNFTINNGIFKFNNDVAIANRNFTVNGNATVGTTGAITVGTTNSRHEFNLNGDFTNDGGTAYFTQRTSANTNGAEATDGIVDVNMVSATQDQQISCNGVTRFYRIEISKGTDDTFKASIVASVAANFNLFGKANYDINEINATANANGTNLNALGLNYGTVEIGANVSIPSLNTVSNYAIYEGARLWVNGGSVTKPSGTAIVPYGTLRVSSGTLSAPISSGITIRESGVIQIEGGTVSVNQIRTSVAGISAVGSYIQSGGDVTLTGNSVSGDYAVLSLTYTGNVFNMSGGTLTVQSASDLGTSNIRGVIFINSDPSNVNITGGTVIMEADLAVNYRITSRASFWNVIMRGTGGSRAFQLLGTTSGSGGGANEPSVAIQPLIVLNDFTVENNASFTTNNANVTVSGNFEIQNGGDYIYGTNTTTINGTGVSSLIFGNIAAPQSFNNLTINKTNTTDEVVIISGNATALRVNGILTISKGIFNYATFTASARGTVALASGVTVGKSTSTGKLLLDGTTDQTIASSGAGIYNIELNNTDATPVITLSTGNLTVYGTLTMTSGLLDINTRRLTLNGASAVISGSGFSTTKMIQLAGNAGDEGLEMYFNANEVITYPIGTGANSTVRYTPVTTQTQSFVDDGYIRISIEDALLQLANLPATNSLDYNWRVNYSSFTTVPKISYQFTYAQFDVTGSEASFVPGSVLTVSPFTRSSEPGSDINTTSNVLTFNGTSTGGTFPGVGFNLTSAAYTAGASGLFTGSPTVFYNRENGVTGWNDNNKWSLAGFNGTATNNQPGAGDVVMLKNTDGSADQNSWVNMDVDVQVAAINFDNTGGGWLPRVTVTNGRTVSLGVVSGSGEIMVEALGGLPTLNTTDIGDFANQVSSLFIYKVEDDVTYTMYPAFTQYPNLRIEGNDGTNNNGLRVMRNTSPVIVNRDLWMDWGGTYRAEASVTVGRNLLPGAGGGGGGRFQFGENGSHTITVTGDVISSNSANDLIEVLNTTPATRVHTLKVGGNITQTTGQIDLYNGTGTANNAILEVNGNTSGVSYTNASGNTPDLFRLVTNKGSSIATTFTVSSNMTLNGPFDQAVKPLELQNGLLILNNALINYTLTSGGTDFTIPAAAGLEVRAGTVSTTTTSTNANIVLDGLLRISGGTATVDAGVGFPNYIEYTNSGNSAIEVTGGTLTVGGQVRRSSANATGVLKYTQSAGTVVVGNRGTPVTDRGVFEVLNTGSQFNHSGGSFTIVQGINSSTVPSLWLEPASSTITSGSTITIGNASTPSGANSVNIGIQSTAVLNNLVIAGSNNPVAKIYITPLTVNGNLTVSGSTTLNANSQDLTIGGNFTVDGSYVPTSRTTTFTNTAAAAISGTTPLFNFYNFTKSGAGTLSISKDITINQDMKALAGTIATTSFAVNLKRHALIDATITSTSGSGLIFNGSVQQQLTRSAAGTGSLGIMTINNSSGVIIPDGNGYNFNITTGLRLQQGVFDIGGSLLFLQTAATITPVNVFSITNMIQTNSSFTDKGVKKQFPLNYTTDFTFPVGQLAYTPVTFNFSSPTNTTGATLTPTITVRPANERHPSVVNDDLPATELPSPAAFNDLNNVLQYHWIINADNVANTFKSTMTLSYVQSLVSVTAPYTEVDYIAARILSDSNPTKLINKFTTAEVDETLNTLTFNFSGVTDAGISAEYYAGVDVAIPDNVPIYTTTASGNVNAAIYTPVVPGGGAPTGATVIVQTGHNLTFNVGSINLYETQINAGATVTIPSGSIGHRLGTVTGTGDLRIDSNTGSAVLPAAVYDDFFACTGGGLIYGGTGNYEILGSITALRKITLEGSGIKTLANNDVTICNDFVLNAGTFNNTNGRIVIVQNDVLLNASNLNSLTGTLTVTRDFTQTAGTFSGGTAGTKTIGRNLTVNAGTFTPGSGSTNIIRVNGNMNVAGAATIVTGTGGVSGQRFTFGGSSAQTLTGTFTTTRAFNRFEINNSNGLTVTGNATVISELLLTSGLITNNTNTFLLEATAIATPTDGKSTSFVNGKLSKVLANGQSFTFPIGKSTFWRSGAVNSVTQAGSVTWDMEYVQGAATGVVAAAPAPRNTAINNFLSSDPTILKIANGEFWRVSDGSATSNGRTAKVGLSWGIESDVSANLAQREALKVMSWNGTNWTNNGGTNFQPGGAHTQARGSFLSTAALSFSENIVTLGSTEAANPLPISLAWFKGEIVGDQAYLYWRTESELNNDYFEIQRSFDGGEFEVLGKVQGKGTTKDPSDYIYEDATIQSGKNYFRLKQVDFDGKVAYSKTIVLEYSGIPQLGLRVFPNPTKYSNINFKLNSSRVEGTIIRLFDITGRVVYKTELSSDKIGEEILIKTDNLKEGIYILEAIQGKGRATQRVIITE